MKDKIEILSSILSIPKEELIREIKTIEVEITKYKKYIKYTNQLLDGKPIQQILNKVDFNGVILTINDKVLIPRPETEYLCDLITNTLKKVLSDKNTRYTKEKKLNILEIGVGSGAISVSIGKNLIKLDNFKILGLDISEDAIKVSRKNILDNSLKGLIHLKASDIDSFGSTETYDLIISNPPYIPSRKIKYLNKSVKDYEPIISLDGGVDGLTILREILIFAIQNNKFKDTLQEQTIILEVNSKRQFNTLKKEFKHTFKNWKLLKDQYGRYRFVVISRGDFNNPIYHLL